MQLTHMSIPLKSTEQATHPQVRDRVYNVENLFVYGYHLTNCWSVHNLIIGPRVHQGKVRAEFSELFSKTDVRNVSAWHLSRGQGASSKAAFWSVPFDTVVYPHDKSHKERSRGRKLEKF